MPVEGCKVSLNMSLYTSIPKNWINLDKRDSRKSQDPRDICRSSIYRVTVVKICPRLLQDPANVCLNSKN